MRRKNSFNEPPIFNIFSREKKREKERDELWKKLSELEIKNIPSSTQQQQQHNNSPSSKK